MARKIAKKPSKKKSPAKAKSNAGKSSTAASAKAAGKSKNPAYVLIIMGLVTAIALMVNRYYVRHGPREERVSNNSEPEKVPVRDKTEAGELREEKKSKTDKPDKAEQSDTPEKDQQLEIPEREEVKIYFVKLNEKSEKMYLTPVARKVSRGSPLENTMRELIKGPTANERKRRGC